MQVRHFTSKPTFSVVLLSTVQGHLHSATFKCGFSKIDFIVSIVFQQNPNKGFKIIFTVYGKQKAMILYKEVFEAKAAHLCGRSSLQPAQAISKQEPYV